jgi:hypothetical protein
VKKEFPATCDTKAWSGLSPAEKSALLLNAAIDPVFFWTHPALGNCEPWPAQKEILREFYKTDKNGRRILSDLMMLAGRRSGKTTLSALISGYEVFRLFMLGNPQKHYKISPNSEIQIINVAPKREQAIETIFGRTCELIRNSPWFMCQKHEYVNTSLRYPGKHIVIQPFGSNSQTGVGRTAKAFLADEVSYFTDTENGRSAKDVYNELSKSTATFLPFNEGVNVAISSVRYDGDFLTSRYYQSKESPEGWENTLTVWKPTWELNPDLTEEVLADEKLKDPEEYARQYGAEPGLAVRTFFEETLLRYMKTHAKENNIFGEEGQFIREIKSAPDSKFYIIATDPSAKNDTFGLSLGYVTHDNRIVIVGTTSFSAKKGELIDTEKIRNVIRPLLEKLFIKFYIFDIYMHSDLVTLVQEYGVESFQHTLTRADWLRLKDDLRDDPQNTQLVYFEQLFTELNQLLDVKEKKIDHPPKGSKDAADSVCQITSFIRRNEEKKETFSKGKQIATSIGLFNVQSF